MMYPLIYSYLYLKTIIRILNTKSIIYNSSNKLNNKLYNNKINR